jgi:hypothetical protein
MYNNLNQTPMATIERIESYVSEIEQAQRVEWECSKFDMNNVPEFGIEMGKRFARITKTSWKQKSVHCFVEITTGDIYKAAGWSAPAKGIRGNINNEKKPLLGYDYYR